MLKVASVDNSPPKLALTVYERGNKPLEFTFDTGGVALDFTGATVRLYLYGNGPSALETLTAGSSVNLKIQPLLGVVSLEPTQVFLDRIKALLGGALGSFLLEVTWSDGTVWPLLEGAFHIALRGR